MKISIETLKDCLGTIKLGYQIKDLVSNQYWDDKLLQLSLVNPHGDFPLTVKEAIDGIEDWEEYVAITTNTGISFLRLWDTKENTQSISVNAIERQGV